MHHYALYITICPYLEVGIDQAVAGNTEAVGGSPEGVELAADSQGTLVVAAYHTPEGEGEVAAVHKEHMAGNSLVALGASLVEGASSVEGASLVEGASSVEGVELAEGACFVEGVGLVEGAVAWMEAVWRTGLYQNNKYIIMEHDY